ncbi:MAG: hypothetical protein IPJ71_03220 [Bdellovibrionales bacterium]|nr:hypothetical protein [Bdellovibrionales bacterium]
MEACTYKNRFAITTATGLGSVLFLFLASCSPAQPASSVNEQTPQKTDVVVEQQEHPQSGVYPKPFTPPVLTRGLKWVRSHPMFLSGLNVSMGEPPAEAVNDYLDLFKASAVHTWETGLPFEIEGWRKHRPNLPFVSWVNQLGNSWSNGKFMGGLPPGLPGRIGFQIGDEPSEMNDLREMNDTINRVRKYDPDALLYVNFGNISGNKNYNEMVDFYGKMDADLISYDWYSRQQRTYKPLEGIRKEGLKYNRPYWKYLRSYLDQPKDRMTESDARWDAFGGVLYGFTGFTWFLYQISPKESELNAILFEENANFLAKKTAMYAMISNINRELVEYGNVVTQLTSTDVRYRASLFQPRGTKAWSYGAGDDPYIKSIRPASKEYFLDLSIGYFRDDRGELYTMIQNTRHSSADFPLGTIKSGRVEVDFSVNPNYAKVDQLLWLNTKLGREEIIPLKSVGNNVYRLEVSLPAGEAMMFKYVTGKPFARR